MELKKIPFAFSFVRFINTPNEGIAKTNRRTRELVINLYWWKQLSDEHKFFVLAHEEGHVMLNTRDEFDADRFAHKKYLDAGLSITQSIHALTRYLNTNNPVHVMRAWLQYQRALQHDYQVNGNAKAFRPKYETPESLKAKIRNV